MGSQHCFLKRGRLSPNPFSAREARLLRSASAWVVCVCAAAALGLGWGIDEGLVRWSGGIRVTWSSETGVGSQHCFLKRGRLSPNPFSAREARVLRSASARVVRVCAAAALGLSWGIDEGLVCWLVGSGLHGPQRRVWAPSTAFLSGEGFPRTPRSRRVRRVCFGRVECTGRSCVTLPPLWARLTGLTADGCPPRGGFAGCGRVLRVTGDG